MWIESLFWFMCGVEAKHWVHVVSVSHTHACGQTPDWPCKPSRQARLVRHETKLLATTYIPFAQVFTEADQAELQHVIKEINKRIPLGGFVSENRLIGELVRLGVDERLVRRALVFLVSSQAYEYKKARQTLHRICT